MPDTNEPQSVLSANDPPPDGTTTGDYMQPREGNDPGMPRAGKQPGASGNHPAGVYGPATSGAPGELNTDGKLLDASKPSFDPTVDDGYFPDPVYAAYQPDINTTLGNARKALEAQGAEQAMDDVEAQPPDLTVVADPDRPLPPAEIYAPQETIDQRSDSTERLQNVVDFDTQP